MPKGQPVAMHDVTSPASMPRSTSDLPSSIGHFCRIFLRSTEMYIYHQLRTLRRYRPVVLARSVTNQARFPWEPVFTSESALSPGIRHVADLMHRGRLLTPWERLYFTGIAEASRIRLIHAHHGQDGRYVLPLVRSLHVPLVTSFYGWDASQLPRTLGGLGRFFLRPLFQDASLILALSEAMAAELATLGCPRDKIRVQRVGVEVEAADFRPRSSPPTDEPITLVSVGRFIEKKGFSVLIRAFAIAHRIYPNLQLVLVGDGPLRPELEALVSDLGLGSEVQMTGFLPHAEVQTLFGHSHIVVQASLTASSGDKEGIPGVLMEGMATGLPAISTYHAGIPELVRDGVSGRLVPEGDIQGLAHAISDVVGAPEVWPAWGRAGHEYVMREHNVVVQRERLEQFYDEILEASSANRPGRT
jgi:colanic acid/amylovoran biosynthesis glycosyltransferase